MVKTSEVFHSLARRGGGSFLDRIEQKEAREILPVVFNGTLQDGSAVNGRGHIGGDGGGIRALLIHHHLHAAGGIIERHPLQLRVAGEEFEALVQRHRVRIDLAQVPESDARRHDQVVHDPDVGFRSDPHIEMQQMIVIFVDRSGQGVFHRDYRRGDLSGCPKL